MSFERIPKTTKCDGTVEKPQFCQVFCQADQRGNHVWSSGGHACAVARKPFHHPITLYVFWCRASFSLKKGHKLQSALRHGRRYSIKCKLLFVLKEDNWASKLKYDKPYRRVHRLCFALKQFQVVLKQNGRVHKLRFVLKQNKLVSKLISVLKQNRPYASLCLKMQQNISFVVAENKADWPLGICSQTG